LVVGRVPQLVTPLANFQLVVQDAVHRADRADVPPLVQQRRVDLGRGLVGERLAVEHVEDLPALLVAQRSRWPGPWPGGGCRRFGLTPPVERCSGHAHTAAGCGHGSRRNKFLDGLHGMLPLLSCGGRGIPRISESFFWTSMIVSA